MRNRVPVSREARPALPAFAPVPRKYRHDGWTPERQKAFIEALADTGSVARAARAVNMAQANCYTLRRAPGAEEFRRAWEAALDFGVQRLKDIALERAIDGYLVPVMSAGKLVGYRRKVNDRLLMFCLRHYGQDAAGRRTTINYFSARAAAGEGAAAQASATTVRAVVSGGAALPEAGADAAATIAAFGGVALDAEAAAAIDAALEACAARVRAADAVMAGGGEAATLEQIADPDVPFVHVRDVFDGYTALLEAPSLIDATEPFGDDAVPWQLLEADPSPGRDSTDAGPARRRVNRA